MKFLYYFYYRVYGVCVSISDDFMNAIKPTVIMGVTIIQLTIQAVIWYSILTKSNFSIDPIFGLITVSILTVVTYLIFFRNNEWKKNFQDFQNYSPNKKTVWDISIVVIIFGVLAFTIFSFYRLSQIDWSKYGQ
jgi:hypothetical protein